MPAGSDHIRRDAEHAARALIAVELGKFRRRLEEAAKAHIGERLANADPGEPVDGTRLGFEASEAALASYLVDATLAEPIEATAAVGAGTTLP